MGGLQQKIEPKKLKMFPSRPRQRMDTSGDGVFKQRRQFQPRRRRFVRRRNMGRQALREVRQVKRVLNKSTELKHVTTNVTINLVAGTAQTQSLVLLSQGDTAATRNGDKISVQNIAYRFSFKLADNETIGSIVRFMVIVDRKPAGAQAAITDVLTAAGVNNLMNLSNRGRFQVIHDQVFTLNVNGNQYRYEKAFMNMKGMKVFYDGNNGDITDLQKNNIFGLFISGGNDQNLAVGGTIRVRFTDD